MDRRLREDVHAAYPDIPTQDEVRALAEKYGMDFDDLENWYDGYQIGDEPSMFNPNSVMMAVDIGRCRVRSSECYCKWRRQGHRRFHLQSSRKGHDVE